MNGRAQERGLARDRRRNDLALRPIVGRRILITRAKHQAGALSDRLRALGAEAIEWATIVIEPPTDWSPVDGAVGGLHRFDWVVLTSANGVSAFVGRLQDRGVAVEALSSVRIAAIGPVTAMALEQRGMHPVLVAKEYTAEGVVAAFRKLGSLEGRRVLLPRAQGGRSVLPDGLRSLGAEVEEVVTYVIRPSGRVPPEISRRLERREINLLTFASSSTVRSFEAGFPAGLPSSVLETPAACIGPITARTAEEYGLKVEVVPKRYTIPSLVEAIVEYLSH